MWMDDVYERDEELKCGLMGIELSIDGIEGYVPL